MVYERKVATAARLGVAARTVDRWVQAKVIPVRKIGRVLLFSPEEVDDALTRFRVRAVGERKNATAAKGN